MEFVVSLIDCRNVKFGMILEMKILQAIENSNRHDLNSSFKLFST
jgi:hydroxymethylpyrimidine/phosphomethylpyrimidine kinase